MTTLRPERPADGPMSYEDTGQFEVVVGQLNDPLNDPLPGRPPAVEEPPRPQPPLQAAPQPLQQAAPQPPQPASPWFAGPAPQAPPRQPEPQQVRPPRQHARPPQAPQPPQPVQAQPIQQTVPQPMAPQQPVVPQQPAAPQQPVQPQPVQQMAPPQQVSPQQPEPPRPQGRHSAVRPEPPAAAAPTPLAETDATAQLPQVSLGRHGAVRPEPPAPAAPAASAGPTPLAETDATAQLPQISLPEEPSAAPVADTPADPAPPVLGPPSVEGGRAARRKAAKGGHRARNRGVPAANASAAAAAAAGEGTAPAQPLSRVEARRAAKAAKDSPAVVASRVVGELFITAGVLMLLFVAYQLWWTNVRAHAQANSASNKLEQQWKTDESDPNRAPGTFSPGQGFAIMYIPKLDVKAPIAQGVSKTKVLDHGMIGHYDGALNTAMPWDKTGNFAVAAHRNTHGEPFRYINKLVPGDKVVVETATTYYTYEITSSLASTPPTNISVLQPVPVGSGFTGPGRYLTLTTCTPEFTSTNRLIVWGKMIEERPRSKGKPDALVNG